MVKSPLPGFLLVIVLLHCSTPVSITYSQQLLSLQLIRIVNSCFPSDCQNKQQALQEVPCMCVQSFAEKLFTQLNARYKKETWETRLAMITVTARVIGVHKLLIDEKYYASYLNLVQPRQRDITHVLAALIMVSLTHHPPCNNDQSCFTV